LLLQIPRIILRLLAGLLPLLVAVSAASALEVPAYRGYVNDYAGMLSAGTARSLERTLAEFDRSDSTQIAVLTIPSLEGEVLEEFSIKVVDQWGVGQRGRDNGVLLLVAKQERKVRIEVGYGLEGVLTDLLSGRIVDLVITPAFKAGRYDEGFVAGTAAIIQATRGEYQGAPAGGGRDREPSPLFKFLFFGVVIVAFLGQVSRKAGAAAGALLLPAALLFGLMPALNLLLLLLLVPLAGLAGWVLAPILAALSRAGGHGRYYGGGFGGGLGLGGGRGGGGFGGFGGGGFGGGGFGGGGASGGW
jgi:uncharacterized protein